MGAGGAELRAGHAHAVLPLGLGGAREAAGDGVVGDAFRGVGDHAGTECEGVEAALLILVLGGEISGQVDGPEETLVGEEACPDARWTTRHRRGVGFSERRRCTSPVVLVASVSPTTLILMSGKALVELGDELAEERVVDGGVEGDGLGLTGAGSGWAAAAGC